jgi:hypothetical protein
MGLEKKIKKKELKKINFLDNKINNIKNKKKNNDKNIKINKINFIKKALFFLVIALILICLFFSYLKITGNVIINDNTVKEYQVSEDIPFLYNISVNNTEIDQLSNISQVNITFPIEFKFILNTNGTNSLENETLFQNESNLISWTKDNLIPNSSKINFWFNLTANKTGIYNITLSFLNLTGDYEENLTIYVNDTIAPKIIFNSNSDTNNSAYSRNYTFYNISILEKNEVSSIYVYLYNSSLSLISSNSVLNAKNISGNFSNLNLGKYYLNISVNDSSNNRNSSGLITIFLHKTPPVITLISPDDSYVTTNSTINFAFNVSSGIEIANCRLIINNDVEKTDYDIEVNATNTIRQILSNGTQEWGINCTDIAGNIGNSTKRILNVILNQTSSSSSTNTNSNNSSDNLIVNNNTTNQSNNQEGNSSQGEIREISNNELKTGYTIKIKEKEELKFNISNSPHSLKIDKIFNNNTIKLILKSDPQEFNLSVGEEKKFNLTNKSMYDLKIKLNSIENQEINLTLTNIYEIKKDSDNSKTNLIMVIVLILIFIIIVSLIVFFVLKNKNKKNSGNDFDEDFDDQNNTNQNFMNNSYPNYQNFPMNPQGYNNPNFNSGF